jgi:hypothetical protein
MSYPVEVDGMEIEPLDSAGLTGASRSWPEAAVVVLEIICKVLKINRGYGFTLLQPHRLLRINNIQNISSFQQTRKGRFSVSSGPIS